MDTHTCGLQMGLVCFAVEGIFAGGSLRWPVCTMTSLVLVLVFCFFSMGAAKLQTSSASPYHAAQPEW